MPRQYAILVVEDEERWREDVFREILEDEEYMVETVCNYNQAIAALRRRWFDLVVIDVNLTGVSSNRDGVRVLEWLSVLNPKPMSVVVSGSKTSATAQTSVKKFQPLAFIDKTRFDLGEFLRLLQSVLPIDKETSV